MSNLIVYYSFSGNNRLLANYLQEKLGYDLYEIKERGHRSMFKILFDLVFSNDPSVKTPSVDFGDYDHVILIAPIWASKIGTPLKSMIKSQRENIHSYSFISFCGYEKVGQKTKIAGQLTDLIGKRPESIFEIKVSDLFSSPKTMGSIELSRYKAKKRDLDLLRPQLNKIVNFYRDRDGIFQKSA